VFDFGVKEAKSLASYKQLQQMELRIMNFKGQEADPNFELVLDEETVKTAEAAVQAKLSEEEKAGLASLKKKLKRGIKNMVKVSGGAFVKTSSRRFERWHAFFCMVYSPNSQSPIYFYL
jgi:hypothetical protein